jgi:hypothetical protein
MALLGSLGVPNSLSKFFGSNFRECIELLLLTLNWSGLRFRSDFVSINLSSGRDESGRARHLSRERTSFEMQIVLFEFCRLFFMLYRVISFSMFRKNYF